MILWVHGFLKPWNKNFPALGLKNNCFQRKCCNKSFSQKMELKFPTNKI